MHVTIDVVQTHNSIMCGHKYIILKVLARSNDYVHQTSDKKWPSYTVEPV